MHETLREALTEAARDALAVVFPVSCAGCAAPDRVICLSCQRALAPRVRRIDLEASGRPPLSVWAGLSYEPPIPALLHAFKESGRTNLARALAGPLRAAVTQALRSVASEERVTLVCPPSTREARRSRGYVPLRVLTRRLGLRPATLLSALTVRRDQSTLGEEDRWSNLAGALRAQGNPAGLRILLLDDVVTTGATLHECARALREAGAVVLGAAVIAHTERRHVASVPLPLPLPLPQTLPVPTLSASDALPPPPPIPNISAGKQFFGTLTDKLRDR